MNASTVRLERFSLEFMERQVERSVSLIAECERSLGSPNTPYAEFARTQCRFWLRFLCGDLHRNEG